MNKYYATSIIILALFVILAVLVSPLANNNPSLVGKDTAAFLKVNDSHVPFLNQFMVWLTEYGREAFWIATIVLLFILGGIAGKKTAIVLVLAFIVLIPIGFAAKEIVHRPHPTVPENDFLLAQDPNEYSYPSGHATIVSAGAAVALSLFRDSKRKLAISLALTAEAVLVCISRVYVGGHYPLDVVGGILLGVGVSFLFVGATKQVEKIMQSINRVLKRK
ncbi:MAG TPA: phosphatase PAP2 family protein [Nitrosopumilaceae archaeon]|nr:phosphatase PAP2 family protein [Nitrosopumilaceae archaeon]